MERSIYSSLKKWKESPTRKPLILQGARQVGKTYILKEFGAREYSEVVYINCDDTNDMTVCINGGTKYIFGKNMVSVKADIMYRHNISSKTGIYSSCNENLTATMLRIGEYFAKGETAFGINAGYSRRVWGNKALTVGLSWQHGIYLGNCCDNRYETTLAMTL